MRRVTIYPRKLSGIIALPESKSLAHRAIIAASLAKGKSKVLKINNKSLDIDSTINGMIALGASIVKTNENILYIDGENTLKEKEVQILCNESGSTLRFLIPIALVKEGTYTFTGKGNLSKRPLEPYFDVFKKDDIYYKKSSSSFLNLVVKGKLKGGDYYLEGDVSSQFVTGLLFALPLLEKDSRIILSTKLESKGYIDLTLDILSNFGIVIENIDYREFVIKGNQKYKKTLYEIEKDFSQAAFYFCASALGSKVKVSGMNLSSIQGDKEILNCLMEFGAEILINETENNIEVNAEELLGTEIDGSNIPDIIPIITVVAALAKGQTKISNIGRLRLKESDRIEAIKTELNKIGADIRSGEDYLYINGVSGFSGGTVDSHNDHRIAMSLAIASTRCINPLTIINSDTVEKSYQNFWEDFKSLGGNINE